MQGIRRHLPTRNGSRVNGPGPITRTGKVVFLTPAVGRAYLLTCERRQNALVIHVSHDHLLSCPGLWSVRNEPWYAAERVRAEPPQSRFAGRDQVGKRQSQGAKP